MRAREIVDYSPRLYHLMDTEKTRAVFDQDKMEARWEHIISGQPLRGNSFSRNSKFTFGEERCVRLTIDRRALSSRNRLIPLDGDYVHSRRYFPNRLVYDREDRGRHGAQFAEEFAVGDITAVHRVICKIEVLWVYASGWFYALCTEIKAYAEKWGIECVFHPSVLKWLSDTEQRWAEDNEWQSWEGGKPPVGKKVPVEVQYRDGGYQVNHASEFWWGRDKDESPIDIMAYRVLDYLPLDLY